MAEESIQGSKRTSNASDEVVDEIVAYGDAGPPDPHDREALQKWLETKPREWSVVIAARAALRVLPLGQHGELGTRSSAAMLPLLRAAAITRFAAMYPARAIERAAAEAAFAADSVRVAASAARAAAFKAAYHAAEAAFYSAARAAFYAADKAASLTIQDDAQALMRGISTYELAHTLLWKPGEQTGGFPSSRVGEAWIDLRNDLKRRGTHWQFWIDWYERALRPSSSKRSEAWEAAFTDVQDSVYPWEGPLPWDDGPAAVNLAIKSRLDAVQAAEASAGVPDQSPAPVRVEERDGRIAQVHDHDSPLRTAEKDFNAWRDPVIDHIQELTSGDFRKGTNHSRARDRLVALARLLPGDIAEVKEQQFRIGYEIDRLGGLIAAYRSGGEDMPELNAASLEDLSHLHVALVMGIDKLERWTEFRRLASDDPRREGEADRDAVSDALDEMAGKMEKKPAYFDPELPRSFRFLAEAAKDPVGATKTVVYGAVKSAENLFSFLGQRALGIAKKTSEAIEQNVAKALLIGFGGIALKLSGALPHGWAWLKPLLDALTKVAGG